MSINLGCIDGIKITMTQFSIYSEKCKTYQEAVTETDGDFVFLSMRGPGGEVEVLHQVLPPPSHRACNITVGPDVVKIINPRAYP